MKEIYNVYIPNMKRRARKKLREDIGAGIGFIGLAIVWYLIMRMI